MSWNKKLLDVDHLMHDNRVMYFQDMKPPKSILSEELRHAETNPTCKIHDGYCTSH